MGRIFEVVHRPKLPHVVDSVSSESVKESPSVGYVDNDEERAAGEESMDYFGTGWRCVIL